MQSLFNKYPKLWRIFDILLPFFATLAALAVGAVMLIFLGANPFEAYGALLEGAFGNINALADTLVKATPLLLVALGICIAFRGGVLNIGGEGQLVVGALASTLIGLSFPDAPGTVIIPLALLSGFLAGAIWGAIPGLLKAHFNVNEILSTIMMNAIAVQGMNYLLREPMIDPVQLESASRIPQTARLADAFDLPRLIPTRLHLGFGLAILAAILVYIFLWRTVIGYRIRAVGLNAFASRYAGIKSVPLYCALHAAQRRVCWFGGCYPGLWAAPSYVYRWIRDRLHWQCRIQWYRCGIVWAFAPAWLDSSLYLIWGVDRWCQQIATGHAGANRIYYRPKRFGGDFCRQQ